MKVGVICMLDLYGEKELKGGFEVTGVYCQSSAARTKRCRGKEAFGRECIGRRALFRHA